MGEEETGECARGRRGGHDGERWVERSGAENGRRQRASYQSTRSIRGPGQRGQCVCVCVCVRMCFTELILHLLFLFGRMPFYDHIY